MLSWKMIHNHFCCKSKNEGWGGEFVDLGDDSTIPDGSVIRAVSVDSRSKVCR